MPHGFLKGSATGIAGLGTWFDAQEQSAAGDSIHVWARASHGAILQEGTFSQTVGVMAHEFGHRFGLPDLYDTAYDDPEHDSAGIGRWGLMGWGALGWNGDDGPNPLSAWAREQLGWLGPDSEALVEVIDDRTDLVLEDAQAGGRVYKIPLRTARHELPIGADYLEYLLLEYVDRDGMHYRRQQPGSGLLVWHVRPYVRDNDDEDAKLVDLICADGLYQDAGYPSGLRPDGVGGRDNLDFWAHDPAYAAQHAGNWGDASDLFDGIRFRRLDVDSNPSSHPRLGRVAALQPLRLRLDRHRGRLTAAVTQPRWSGTIFGAHNWAGPVLVDGDLTISPGAKLALRGDVRIRVAGSDRLRDGLDPELVELTVQGDLRLEAATGKAVFEAQAPGQRWHGVVLDLAPSSRLHLPARRYAVRDADHGVSFADEPGAGRQEIGLHRHYQIFDPPAVSTHGNGDGLPGPGETFELILTVNNWSLDDYRRLRIELTGESDILRPAEALQNQPSVAVRQGWGIRLTSPQSLESGGRHTYRQRLVVEPTARPGERVDLIVRMHDEARAWTDTVSLTVQPGYPAHRAQLRVPARQGDSIVLPAERETVIEAVTAAGVEAAYLQVHGVEDGELLRELPMRLQSREATGSVFSTPFLPPAGARFRLVLRLLLDSGAVVFGEDILETGPSWFERPAPVVVMLGDAYSTQDKAALERTFQALFESQQRPVHVLHTAPAAGSFYRELLEHYGDELEVIFWLGDRLDPEAQLALGGFLDRGGHLGLASASVHLSQESAAFLERRLHTGRVRPARSSAVRSLDPDAPNTFEVRHARLAPRPPAVASILDVDHAPAALQVDTGTYRVSYFSFDLRELDEPARRRLLAASGRFLQQRQVQAARLAVSGQDLSQQPLVLSTDTDVAIQAAVSGRAESADLLLRSLPDGGLAHVWQLDPVDAAAGVRRFEATVRLDRVGHYQLSLRLHTDVGPMPYPVTVDVLALDVRQPVLVLLGPQYAAPQKDLLRTLLHDILGPERGAQFIDLPPDDRRLYDALLTQQLDPGDLVVLLSDNSLGESQSAFDAFLAHGGRLLVATRGMPFSLDFLNDRLLASTAPRGRTSVLRRIEAEGQAEASESFSLQHLSFADLRSPARPVVADADGRAAGWQVDVDDYRATFLGFELLDLPDRVRRRLVAEQLRFLAPTLSRQADLLLRPPTAKEVIESLRLMTPKVEVENSGQLASESFDVGYQILQGQQPVAEVWQHEEPLDAGARRTVVLPAWTPPSEGDFRLRTGLAPGPGAERGFHHEQALRVLSVPTAFEPVPLPDSANSNGAGFFDYDSDGDMDFYLVRLDQANQLFSYEAGRFVNRAELTGLDDEGTGRGFALGDADDDGDLDVYLVNEGANRLFHHEPGGPFVDRTTGGGAGTLADPGPGRSAAFFDSDQDGDLDLYLVNARGNNRLYENDGGYVARDHGLDDPGNGRGLALGDFDDDGDTDVFVANASGGSRLYRNLEGRFHNVTDSLNVDVAPGVVAGVFGDYDNDGDIDLFASNQSTANQLFRNDAGAFRRQTVTGGLDLGGRTVGTAFLDYDNDGDLDLATTSLSGEAGGDQLFHNLGGDLVPVGDLLGLEPRSEGRGLSVADFDGDGDVDLLVADADGSRLYRNRSEAGAWIQVDLAGPPRNQHGIGTRIEIVGRDLRQVREAQSGLGYGSQVPPRAHFGLGSLTVIDTLRALWPSGLETVQTGVAVNQHLVVAHPARVATVAPGGQERPPASFVLHRSFPNPFNPTTTIGYDLPTAGPVRLSIFNGLGHEIRQLVDGRQPAGSYQVRWDGRDEAGRDLASGVYLYRLQAGHRTETRRLLLLR